MTSATKLTPRGVFAATSGNVLEWYDFTVYGFLAPVVGQAFFPQDDPVAATLSAFAVLAVGYLSRPLGSVIFGHIGDRVGRKPALIISVLLMGAGSVAIGLLPTYAELGLWASALLVTIRIVQGVAVAGEYSSSGILLVEMAQPGRRHFTGSWIAFAMTLGCVVGSGVPALISSLISPEAMADWGWRIAFLLGGIVALTSAVLRTGLAESMVLDTDERPKSPVLVALRHHWRAIGSMVLLIAPIGILYFLIFVYATSYLTSEMHFTTRKALDFSTINLIVLTAFVLPLGLLADRIGARVVLVSSVVLTVVFAIPFWQLMHENDDQLIFLGQMGFAILNAAGWALSISALSDLVPASVRCSAVTIGYNSALAIFGGTTPFLATYLVNRTADDFAPAYYLIGSSLLALFVIWQLPKPIEDPATET